MGNQPQWHSRTPCGADCYSTDLERSHGTGNRPQTQCSTPCGADYYPTPYYIPPPPNHPADQPYDSHPDNHTSVHTVAVKAVQSTLPSESIDAGKLSSVQDVLHKHKKLACASKVGTLAVKLAKQA